MSEYINNIIYGVNSFVTGLKVTWNHFMNKKDLVATLQYPHEKWPIPERNIGFDHSEYNLIRSRLHVDIDDCIACMQCEKHALWIVSRLISSSRLKIVALIAGLPLTIPRKK